MAIRSSLLACKTIYNQYEDIINTYVADFYLEEHWDKLPSKWKSALENSEVEDVEEVLRSSQQQYRKVYPLSLLSLKKTIEVYSISRKFVNISILSEMFNDNRFIKFFWRGVKLKKRHEITAMSQMCYRTALKTNCFNIVDVGSGLGHLSRLLSYGFGFNVVTFECNSKLSNLSTEIDSQFENMLEIKHVEHKRSSKIVHISKKIDVDLSEDEFLRIIRESFNINSHDLKFGIVGLHPCGDLGATLLRLFKNCQSAVFINMVSCCYMKLSLNKPNPCFPLSKFCIANNFKLDYLSCELACHAIETYIERLTEKEYQKLKIHAFRAALEYVLVRIKPELKHSPVCNFKYDTKLSFKDYCSKTFQKYNLEPSLEEIIELEALVNQSWKKVVVFFSMRLLLAPVIETILLYDRLLYIKESISDCIVIPVFDSTISPRNHVLSATKLDMS